MLTAADEEAQYRPSTHRTRPPSPAARLINNASTPGPSAATPTSGTLWQTVARGLGRIHQNCHFRRYLRRRALCRSKTPNARLSRCGSTNRQLRARPGPITRPTVGRQLHGVWCASVKTAICDGVSGGRKSPRPTVGRPACPAGTDQPAAHPVRPAPDAGPPSADSCKGFGAHLSKPRPATASPAAETPPARAPVARLARPCTGPPAAHPVRPAPDAGPPSADSCKGFGAHLSKPPPATASPAAEIRPARPSVALLARPCTDQHTAHPPCIGSHGYPRQTVASGMVRSCQNSHL